MKITIFTMLSLVALNFSLCWALDQPLIDPAYSKIEEKIAQLTIECEKKEKNRAKQFRCHQKVRSRYEEAGKIRGLEQYCEFNYSKLSFKDLEALLRQLRKLQKFARSSADLMWKDELAGEVTKEDLQTELIWIESRLARMKKATVDKMEKSIKSQPGWAPKKKQ